MPACGAEKRSGHLTESDGKEPQMDKSALYKVSYGLYITGVQNGAGYGGCVVDAFMQTTDQTADAPATAVLCSMRNTRSNALIQERGVFTLSVLPAGVDPLLIAIFGFQSARNTEKWVHVDYTERNGLPVLGCACAGMMLRTTGSRELSTHTLFFCDIEDAWSGEGEPLLYAEYQRSLKPAAMAAFKEFIEK